MHHADERHTEDKQTFRNFPDQVANPRIGDARPAHDNGDGCKMNGNDESLHHDEEEIILTVKLANS